MRSLLASIAVLAFAAILAVQVGAAVNASVGKLTDALSLSRSVSK